MAEQDIRVGIQADTNFPSVVNKVVGSVSRLQNNLDDLVGVLQDMAKASSQGEKAIGSISSVAQGAGSNASKAARGIASLGDALKLTGKNADEAFSQLGQSFDTKELRSQFQNLTTNEAAALDKKLREIGTTAREFLRTGDIDLDFRPALEQLNELQRRLSQPLSSGADFIGTDQILARTRRAVQEIRSEVESGLEKINVPDLGFDKIAQQIRSISVGSFDEIEASLNRIGSSLRQFPGGLDEILNFEEVRSGARAAVDDVERITNEMRQLEQAAKAGIDGEAVDSFRKLSVQLDIAKNNAKEFTNQIDVAREQFKELTSAQNAALQNLGFGFTNIDIKPIRFEDIFPSAEQQKLVQLGDRIQREVKRGVEEAALRKTIQDFTGIGLAAGQLNSNVVQLTSTLPRLRYALYDVRNTATIAGAALIGLGAGVIKVGADFERAFADVQRTVGDGSEESIVALGQLRKELVDLSQTIPVSFADLAGIATLAGQLNIAEDRVANFTETVAKFTATTDVTLEAAATAFGRLDQLVAGVDGQFDKLASSILAVGVNAVATESDIIAIAGQISSIANIAGFTASELVGFSSALASVGTRPELARGTFTRLFTEIQQSVGTGSEQLEAFARTAGLSVAEFEAAWGAGSGAEVVVSILRGLQAEGKNADRALAELGITSVRDVPTILKLAQGVGEVERQLAIARIGFIENTELTDQYGVLSETLAAKLERLANSFQSVIATFGEGNAAFKFLIDRANDFLIFIQDLFDNPVGKFFGATAVSVTIFAGIVSLATAAIAGLLASFSGLFTALVEARTVLGEASINIQTLAASMDKLAVSSTVAAGAVNSTNSAIDGIDKNTKTTANGFILLGDAADDTAKKTEKTRGGILGLGKQFLGTGKAATTFRFALGLIKWNAIGLAVTTVISLLGKLAQEFEWFGEKTSDAAKETERLQAILGDDTSSFMEAVRKDTIDFEAGLQKVTDGVILFSGEIENSNVELSERGKVIAAVTGQEDLLKQSVDGTTTAIDNQTLAIGRNTQALIKEKLAQELLNKVQEDALTTRKVRELLAQQEVATSQPGAGISAEGIRLARNAVQEQGAGVGIGSLFEIISDPGLSARLEAAGFDFQAWVDAVTAGNADVANSIAQQLGPAASQLADILDEENPEAYADAIVYLRGAAAFGAKGLQEFSSAGSDLQKAIKQLIFEQTILGESFGDTGQAVEEFREAMFGLVDEAYAQVNAQNAVKDAVTNLGAAFQQGSADVVANSQEMQTAIKAVLDTASTPEEAITALSGFYSAIVQGGYASGEQLEILQGIIKQTFADFVAVSVEALKIQRAALQAAGSDRALFNRFEKEVPASIKNASAEAAKLDAQIAALEGSVDAFALSTGNAAEYAGYLADGYSEAEAAAADTAKAAKDVADETEEATKEVRTLLDYASDLEKVFSRAFDIRFGSQSALDKITAGWESFAQNVNDAKNAVEELRQSQEDLAGDIAIKQYFLSVAEAYGDTLRASKLRSEIADLESKRLQQQAELEKARSRTEGATALEGDSEQARGNRAALTGLVKNYQDYIKVLAESGASQKELKAATEDARQQFIQQATELGFQETVVLEYAKAFDDVQTAISKVERNITVEANVDPALTALAELRASLQTNINKAKELNSELKQKGGGYTPPSDPNAAEKASIRAQIAELESALAKADGSDRRFYQTRINALKKRLALLWTGGYTGAGGKYEPAGIVHRGEYVVPKHMVNQSTGLPNQAFLAQMQNANRGYAQGGFVGGGGTDGGTIMVELSPYDRKLLADAGNVQLSLNGRVVAEATNQSNYNQARRGAN